MSGSKWVTGLISILLHFSWNVWNERNEDRHGRDKTEKERLLVERALLQLEELYKIRLDVLPRHRNLFYDNVEQHKQVDKTSKSISQWLYTWSSVIHHSAATAREYGITRMGSIMQYFNQNS